MKSFLSCLLILTICTGCSCSMGGSEVKPTPSATPSSSPSPSASADSETMNSSVMDYVDYLKQEYSLMDPMPIENLDANALDGYTFGLNNESYYLVLLDSNNTAAQKWMNEIGTNGQIDVDIDGLTKTMNALVNGNYVLLSSTDQYADGFKDYYNAFSGQQALPGVNTPDPSATPQS